MRFTKTKAGTGNNKAPAKRELGAHQQSRQLQRKAAPERPEGPAGPLEPHEVAAAKRIRKEQAKKEEKAPPRGQKRGGGDGGFEYPTIRLRFDSGAGARAPETTSAGAGSPPACESTPLRGSQQGAGASSSSAAAAATRKRKSRQRASVQ